jgi:hypothetical protein
LPIVSWCLVAFEELITQQKQQANQQQQQKCQLQKQQCQTTMPNNNTPLYNSSKPQTDDDDNSSSSSSSSQESQHSSNNSLEERESQRDLEEEFNDIDDDELIQSDFMRTTIARFKALQFRAFHRRKHPRNWREVNEPHFIPRVICITFPT